MPPALTPPFKLNIGGGKKHPRVPGWLIVDLRPGADIQMDLTADPLPFPDNSVDLIFCSHTLEHFQQHDLAVVLDEFHRVLKPADQGGMLRIAVPDIEKAIDAYVRKDLNWFQNAEISYADPKAPIGGLLASWFYSTSEYGNGHVHCFDFEYLAWWLRKHGFDRIERNAFRQSACEELRGDAFDRRDNASIFVDAWKSRNA